VRVTCVTRTFVHFLFVITVKIGGSHEVETFNPKENHTSQNERTIDAKDR
jgi:hypothetical protein